MKIIFYSVLLCFTFSVTFLVVQIVPQTTKLQEIKELAAKNLIILLSGFIKNYLTILI